jgi:hypothetical protein
MVLRIAHEAPLDIMMRVQEVTDYDYALVHLFEENEEYLKFFKRAVKVGREVILDNSVFELGTAFDKDKYYHWVEELNPTYYIIPDVLEDAQATVKNVHEWQHLAGKKSIGVVQGKSVEEIVWCYQEIEPHVDKVAISFDYSFFINEDINGKLPTKFHHYMYGRDALLNYMLNIAKVINTDKPHHLLGCGLPQEFEVYRDYKWLDSVDTSNPVVAGLKGIRYNSLDGLEDKPSEKLYTLIEFKPTNDQFNMIMYNIEMFRAIVNGK